MQRERLTTIWSLARHEEVPVRIYYRISKFGNCRIFTLERVEDLTK